jgi:hypothetical protein
MSWIAGMIVHSADSAVVYVISIPPAHACLLWKCSGRPHCRQTTSTNEQHDQADQNPRSPAAEADHGGPPCAVAFNNKNPYSDWAFEI